MKALPEKSIHQVFEFSVLLKGAHALLEIVSGVVIIFLSPHAVTEFVANLTADELVLDPNDIVSNFLLHQAELFAVGGKVFAAWYLLSHGVIKIFLVAGLLRGKLWAYPASLVVLVLFIVYQIYRYTHTHSIGLVLLSIFDVVVLWLIWHEYRLVRKHLPLT